jgi:hypothetical protein
VARRSLFAATKRRAGLGKMLMASQDVDQMVDVGAAMSGVQLDLKPR